jgi:hypothetical protein
MVLAKKHQQRTQIIIICHHLYQYILRPVIYLKHELLQDLLMDDLNFIILFFSYKI